MDPLTIGALSAVALNEDVKFIYQQAAELIKNNQVRRELRQASRESDRRGRQSDRVGFHGWSGNPLKKTTRAIDEK